MVVVVNLVVLVPVVFFDAPGGNPLLLWTPEAVAVSLVAISVFWRQGRWRLPGQVIGTWSPAAYLTGFLLSCCAVIGFVMYAFARVAGIEFSTRGFWLPLLVVLLRVAVDALRVPCGGFTDKAASRRPARWGPATLPWPCSRRWPGWRC